MLKKEKPMMTVAAIIQQQNRWLDQHTLQAYNRFQGSYCKYFDLIFLFILKKLNRCVSIFTHKKFFILDWILSLTMHTHLISSSKKKKRFEK